MGSCRAHPWKLTVLQIDTITTNALTLDTLLVISSRGGSPQISDRMRGRSGDGLSYDHFRESVILRGATWHHRARTRGCIAPHKLNTTSICKRLHDKYGRRRQRKGREGRSRQEACQYSSYCVISIGSRHNNAAIH